MSKKLNLDLTNTVAGNVITDELKTDVGAEKFSLEHDRFYGSTDLRIWTGAGESGIQLEEGVDYTIEDIDEDLTERAEALVYGSIKIKTVGYQTGDLYFNYNVCGDLVDADDNILQDGSTPFTGTGAGFKDEDNMSSNSPVAVASQQSIKKYVDDQDLWEIDESETQLKTADEIDMQSKKIIHALNPDDDQDVATKKFVVDGDALGFLADGSRAFTGTGNGFKDEDDMASNSAVAAASQQSIRKYVDDELVAAGGSEDFVGVVKMYNGVGLDTPDTRTEAVGFRVGDTTPERPGWYVCNGQSGTPDLRNKFIRSENASGNTGGADTHTLSVAEMPSHTHIQNAHNHTRAKGTGFTAGQSGHRDGYIPAATSNTGNKTAVNQNTGGDTAHENKPAYYSLIFIIKMS